MGNKNEIVSTNVCVCVCEREREREREREIQREREREYMGNRISYTYTTKKNVDISEKEDQQYN